MFNPEQSTLSPQEHYQRMLASADARLASLKDKPFANDPKIMAGWQQEREQSLVRAAEFIVGLAGKAATQDLRDAVAPEDLREVLLRANAGYEVLMMVGEGKKELDEMVKKREKDMQEVGALVEEFSDPNVQSVLERLWKKTKEAEAKLLPFESKDVWTKLDAGYYLSFQQKFAEELENVKSTCEKYKEMMGSKKR